MTKTLFLAAFFPLCAISAACSDSSSVPRYELRWCTEGATSCVLKRDEGAIVKLEAAISFLSTTAMMQSDI